MLASSPELEDPLPPKMPRFRVALSPSAPEIVPFWGSGEAGFGREDRDSGFLSSRRPAARSSTWCGRRPIVRRCEGLKEAEGSSGDVALGSLSLPSLVVSAGAPVDS